MSETKEEYAHGIYMSNRKQSLRDLTIKDLIDLIPNDSPFWRHVAYFLIEEHSAPAFWDDFQEFLIDHIVEQNLDSQINGDVK